MSQQIRNNNIRSLHIQDLNKKQQEIFDDIYEGEHKFSVIRASRQSGKSYLLIRLTVWLVSRFKNGLIGFVSADNPKNEAIFNRFLNDIPPSLIKDTKQAPLRSITFINNTVINFYSAGSKYSKDNPSNTAIGNAFDGLVADEVALWYDGVLALLTPTVAAKKDAKLIMASTPRGKNDFYRKCLEGQDLNNHFIKEYRMSYLDNENYDVVQLEYEKKSMSDIVFRQEYLAEFVFGQSSIFGVFSDKETITQWPDIDIKKTYYAGIDWGGAGDDTIICIIDNYGDVSYVEEIEAPDVPNQVSRLEEIIKRYNAHTYSECNGLGKGGTEYLEIDFPELITKFNMSNESKNDIVSQMIFDLNNNILKLPTPDICPKLDNQMATYQALRTPTGKVTYSHPSGLHDDYVDALLIANWARHDGKRSDTIMDINRFDNEDGLSETELLRKRLKDLSEGKINPELFEDGESFVKMYEKYI